MLKIEYKFTKSKQKTEKMFLISYIIASKNHAILCVYQEGNTCYRQSMG